MAYALPPLTLSQRILAAFGVVLVFSVALSIYVVLALQAMADRSDENTRITAATTAAMELEIEALREMLLLDQYADTGDAKTFHRTAHSLKSASVGVGAVAMATLAAELVALGRAGTIRDTVEAVGRFEAMRAPVKEKLRALRGLYG